MELLVTKNKNKCYENDDHNQNYYSNKTIPYATIGCFVKDVNSGIHYAITCYHVKHQ